jgi:hypothetical protein
MEGVRGGSGDRASRRALDARWRRPFWGCWSREERLLHVSE